MAYTVGNAYIAVRPVLDRSFSSSLSSQMSTAGATAGTTSSRSFGSRFTSGVATAAKRTALGVAAIGVAGGAAITKAAVSLEAEFGSTMNQLAAAGDVPKRAMRELSDLALKMGKDTVFSASDASQAMLELAKGGLSAAEIQGGALKGTLTLAAAGGLEMAEAATVANTAMGQFNLKGKDMGAIAAALAGAANASSADVSDLAIALRQGGLAANSVGFSIQETTGIFAAFSNAGLEGSDAGTSLKTMLDRLVPSTDTATVAMEKLGLITASTKGTTKEIAAADDQLEEAQRRVTAAIKDAGKGSSEHKQALDGLYAAQKTFNAASGVGTNLLLKSNGEYKSAAQIAGILQDKTEDLSASERKRAITQIFGSDAQRAATIFAEEGAAGIRKMTEATSDQSAAQQMAKSRMQGTAGAIESMKGSLETAMLAFGMAIKPVTIFVTGLVAQIANRAVPLIQDFGKQLRHLMQDLPKIDLGSIFGSLREAVQGLDWRTVSDAFSGIFAAIRDAAPQLRTAGQELPTLTDGLRVGGVLFRFAAEHADLLAKALPYLIGGFLALKVAQAASNIAATAAIPLRVAEVIANTRLTASNRQLTAATLTNTTVTRSAAGAEVANTAAKNTGIVATVRSKVATIAKAVAEKAAAIASKAMAAATWLVNAAMRANPIGLVVTALVALGAGLVLAYKKSETFRRIVDAAWAGIKKAAQGAWDVMKGVFAALKAAFGAVADAVKKAWGFVTSDTKTAWNKVKTVLGLAWGAIKKGVGAAWEWIKTRLDAAWTWVKRQLGDAVKGWRLVLGAAWGLIKDAAGAAWQWIKSKLGDAWTWIKTQLKDAASGWKLILSTAWDAIKDAAGKAWQAVKTKIGDVWDGIKTLIGDATAWVKGKLSDSLDAWKLLFSNAWSAIKDRLGTTWDGIETLVGNATGWVKDKLADSLAGWKLLFSNAWDAIKTRLGTVWDGIKTLIRNALDAVKTSLSNAWDAVKTGAGNAWDAVKTKIGDAWSGIKDTLGGVKDFLVDKVVAAFESAVTSIGTAWDRLKAVATAPINFVLGTVYNDGLRAAFGFIAEALGFDNPLPYAKLIGDGSVVTALNAPGFAHGGVVPGPDLGYDSQLIRARGREAVMVPEFTDWAGPDRIAAMNRAAAAGKDPLAYSGIGGPIDWAKGVVGKTVGWVKDHLLGMVDNLMGGVPGGAFGQMMGGVPRLIAGQAADWLTGKFGAASSGSTSAGGTILGGAWIKPLTDYVLTAGYPSYPSGGYHSGIDLAGPAGTPVRAASAGRVVASADILGVNPYDSDGYASLGRYVKLLHAGGIETTYGHMLDRAVATGASIASGATIGRRGSTGNSSGDHVHFETRANGSLIDPETFFAGKGIAFDRGGMLRPGLSLTYNGTGGPEAVLTGEQWQSLKRLIESVFVGNRPGNITAGFLRDQLGRTGPTPVQLKGRYSDAMSVYRKQLEQVLRARNRLSAAEDRAKDIARELAQAEKAEDKDRIRRLRERQREVEKLTRLRTRDYEQEQRQADRAEEAAKRAAEAYAEAQRAAIERARGISGSVRALGALDISQVGNATGLIRSLRSALGVARRWARTVRSLIVEGLRGPLLTQFIDAGPSVEAVRFGQSLAQSGEIQRVLLMQQRLARIGDRVATYVVAGPRPEQMPRRDGSRHRLHRGADGVGRRGQGGGTNVYIDKVYARDEDRLARALERRLRRVEVMAGS